MFIIPGVGALPTIYCLGGRDFFGLFPTVAVYRWCKEHLETALFGKRKLAFAESATKTV
ncbi:MAG TPA: hypothetical protein VHR72_10635 [Gemmataceae bacterium]|jgi:hypothetical protein|nr:hypothetical protein [Gemmataceae bacterium]